MVVVFLCLLGDCHTNNRAASFRRGFVGVDTPVLSRAALNLRTLGIDTEDCRGLLAALLRVAAQREVLILRAGRSGRLRCGFERGSCFHFSLLGCRGDIIITYF